MKCEVLCRPCANYMESKYRDGSQYPGEHIKYVSGKNIGNDQQPGGETHCDHCGKHIEIGVTCNAVTTWSDGARFPYAPWESNFIQVDSMQSEGKA